MSADAAGGNNEMPPANYDDNQDHGERGIPVNVAGGNNANNNNDNGDEAFFRALRAQVAAAVAVPRRVPRPRVPEDRLPGAINQVADQLRAAFINNAMFAEAVRLDSVTTRSNPRNPRDLMICVALMPGGTELSGTRNLMTLNQEDMRTVNVPAQLGRQYMQPDTWFPQTVKNSPLFPYISTAFGQRLGHRIEVREGAAPNIPSQGTIQLPARAHQDGWVNPTELDMDREVNRSPFIVHSIPEIFSGRRLVVQGLIIIGFLWVE
jgi:hypothetical protein